MPPTASLAKPASASLVRLIEQEDYEHPAFAGGGAFGRVLAPRAEVTDSPVLLHGGKFIGIYDALRPPLVLAAAGADVIEGAPSDLTEIGRITAGIEAGYLHNGESHLVQVFNTGGVWMGDTIVVARIPYSRRFRLQVEAAEQLVRRHLRRAMKSATERAVLAGTGSNGEPRGLINTAELPLVTGAISRANVLGDLQTVLDAATDPSTVSVFASSKDFSKLITTDQPQPGTTGAIHQLGGFGVRFSPHLAKGDALVGDFSTLTLAYRDQPELVVDRYTQSASGQTVLSGFQGIGYGVSHPEAFICRRAA